MSDDLVRRLRQCSHTCFDERDDHVNPKDTIYWEAGDRIAELEAALQQKVDRIWDQDRRIEALEAALQELATVSMSVLDVMAFARRSLEDKS